MPGVRTFLSRYVLLNPQALLAEERHLRAAGVRRRAAAPDDRRRLRGHDAVSHRRQPPADDRPGPSAGTARPGWGSARRRATSSAGLEPIRAGELGSPGLTIRLRELQARKLAECEQLGVPRAAAPAEWDVLARRAVPADVAAEYGAIAARLRIVRDHELHGTVVFEGAQGVLLDEHYGFHPHTTWSTTTFANADALLREHGAADVLRIGALRAYATRHGEGPFVTEDAALDLPERHSDGRWAGAFRVGYTDLVALRYALRVAGAADGLAITCLDRLPAQGWRAATAYAHAPTGARVTTLVPPADRDAQAALTRTVLASRPVYETFDGAELPERVAAATGLPILLESRGPAAGDKRLHGAARRAAARRVSPRPPAPPASRRWRGCGSRSASRR